MVIEIEYVKGDTFLYGKTVLYNEVKNQLKTVELLYDRLTDNFVELFCRLYGWQIIKLADSIDILYDRDTKLLRKVK